MPRSVPFVLGVLAFVSCRATLPDNRVPEQDAFWKSLLTMCGSAFQGQLAEYAATDTAFIGKPLVMYVRHCSKEATHIAFNIGDDRSRTWILTRIPGGLRLKHDHRHADGSESEITQYGGDTRGAGGPASQEFYADAHTIGLIPAAATNVWTVEIVPGRFSYALRREGTDRRFRVQFDTTRPVTTPPPSWGS